MCKRRWPCDSGSGRQALPCPGSLSLVFGRGTVRGAPVSVRFVQGSTCWGSRSFGGT